MKIFQKVSAWAILCPLGLASHELIDDWIRPVYGTGNGFFPFLLGVSPNLITAMLTFPFFGLLMHEYMAPVNQRKSIQQMVRRTQA